jgi:hypothetical protein
MKVKLVLALLVLTSCSPRYKMVLQNQKEQPPNKNYEVLVLNGNSGINLDKVSLIGEAKGPFEKFYTSPKRTLKGCGYTEITNDLKEKSRQLGANIIHIHHIKKPTSLDNCYKLKARLYKRFDSNLIERINQHNRSRNVSKLDADADYAMVYFYRPKAIAGMVVKFDISMDDNNFITNLKNGEKTSFKIKDFGIHTFTAINQKGLKEAFELNIKKGQEYYVRCGVDVAHPYGVAQISLLDNVTGYSEFIKMK